VVQGGPLALTLWQDCLVVIRPYEVQVFTLPSLKNGPPRLLQTLPFGRYIWEIGVLDNANCNRALQGIASRAEFNNSMEFIATSEFGAHCYRLWMTTESNFELEKTHQHDSMPNRPLLWYRLQIGATGRSTLFVSMESKYEDVVPGFPSPRLIWSSVHRIADSFQADCTSDMVQKPLFDTQFDCTGNLHVTPTLWAFPAIDFDEALGFVVVGNIFGELALYDYGEWPHRDLWSISDNFIDKGAESFEVIPNVWIVMFFVLNAFQ
jgi:hypothetical protein